MSRIPFDQVKKDVGNLVASADIQHKVRSMVAGSCFDPKTGQTAKGKTVEMNPEQWLLYGLKALDTFQKTVSGENEPNWDQVLFREESHFITGAFSLLPQVWVILINAIPAENKAELYHIVHSGLNLFDNLKQIKRRNALFHKGASIKTHFCTNPDNAVKGLQQNQEVQGARVYTRKVLVPVHAAGEIRAGPSNLETPKVLVISMNL